MDIILIMQSNCLSPQVIFYITDRSKAVLLIWFSVFACFGVSFCTVFTLCVSRCYLFRSKDKEDKIKKLCLTSRFETDNISSVELLLRHNE